MIFGFLVLRAFQRYIIMSDFAAIIDEKLLFFHFVSYCFILVSMLMLFVLGGHHWLWEIALIVTKKYSV